MVERISMFLRILNESSELETVANLMLRTSIQISYLHAEILLAVGTMQRRMATYVLENCQDQMMEEVLDAGQQTLAGTHSDLQKLEMIFFRIASEHLFSHLVKSFNSFFAYADWKFRVDRTPYIHDPNVTFDLGQLHQLREWIRETYPRE